MQKLSDELIWRGQIKDKTFGDIKWLDKPQTFYLGVDCSSDSLQIGNLAIFMLARRLAKAGWKAVLLVGGATSMIGDPGGKTEERDLKSRQEIVKNVAAIKDQVTQLFDGLQFKLVDNYDWFKDIGYLEFLRDVGKHYSMTELVQRDFIASRMGESGSGISYAEFSYSLIQGYDFWYLYKNYGTVLQIGGSDQWGNMLSGVPLIRKKANTEVHALSIPLVLNKSTGQKFGKSEGGAIWLDSAQTSVYQFYQFWLNVDDDSAIEFLKIYTELERLKIEDIAKQFKANKSQRLAQKTLAFEVTKIVHGKQKTEDVKNVSQVLFADKPFNHLDNNALKLLAEELPTLKLTSNKTLLIDAMLTTKLCASKTEARQLIHDGSIYLNDNLVTSPEQTVEDEHNHHGYALVQRGKNKFAMLYFKSIIY